MWRNTVLTQEEHDEILRDMKGLLDQYDYIYKEDALNTIIETWAMQKQDLITHFKLHPNYLEGKFMIVFNHDYDREIDFSAGDRFLLWLKCQIGGLKATNEMINALDNITVLLYAHEKTVSDTLATQIPESFHIHSGMKTTRAVNKICMSVGWDQIHQYVTNDVTGRTKDIGYNFEFAKLSDAYSPLSIVRYTILSINPLDYLTMSFGNSWASCHTIDKENRRGGANNYQGCYSSGTISYMLDQTSMVLYTVDADYNGNEFWNQDKIVRQMFHWGEEKLIQGRLYPQSNDGHGDIYLPYREIVQKLVSEMWDLPNRWIVSKGTVAAGRYVTSYGTNYRDYNHYDDCTLSRVRDSDNESDIIVGEKPICIYCGEEHDVEDNISCCGGYVCSDCGCVLNEDEVIWVDGDPYCCDCASRCDCCEEYFRDCDLIEAVDCYGGTIYVCQDCADRYYGECLDCNRMFEVDCMSIVNGCHVCNDCLADYYSQCEDCGEFAYDCDIIRDETDGVRRCCSCNERHLEEIAELESQNCKRITL